MLASALDAVLSDARFTYRRCRGSAPAPYLAGPRCQGLGGGTLYASNELADVSLIYIYCTGVAVIDYDVGQGDAPPPQLASTYTYEYIRTDVLTRLRTKRAPANSSAPIYIRTVR